MTRTATQRNQGKGEGGSAELGITQDGLDTTMEQTVNANGVTGKVLKYYDGNSGDVQLGVYARLRINEPAKAQVMLADYGFKTMIAPSFADIFYGNAINNGMVPVRLKEEEVDALFQLVAAQPGIEIEVDLEANQVRAGSLTFGFEIDEFRRYCLLNGLDAIGLTLQHEAAISAFEAKQPSWI